MIFDVIARTNGAEGSFRAISKEASGAAASFDKLGKAAFGMTAVFAAFAVNAAVKFESAMTRISTQAGVPIGQINALSKAILGLSPKVGFNPDELATSLYHVESAFRTTGITAGKAIGIVENASKLAKIGNADLETTTQAIIGVLASNIKGVKDAQDAAAQLNQLVGAGDTTLQKVAQSIATGILPTAATLGLTFKDVAAGIATLTDNVTPADMAARLLKTSLLTLIKPSAQQTAAFEQLGLGALQLGEDFHKPNGLLTGVQDLKTHLDAVFPATQKTALTTDQLDKAQQAYYQTLVAGGTNAKDATKESEKYRHSIENVSVATLRANTVARALGGSKTAGVFLTYIQEIGRLKSKIDDFGTSAQAAAKFQEAWANQQKTAKQKLDELKASWDVFLVKAGNAILPTLKKIVDALAKHPGIIKAVAGAVGLLAAAWTVSKFASAFSVIAKLTTAILGIGAASTTAAAATTTANIGGAIAGGAAARGGIVALDASVAAGAAPAAANAERQAAYNSLFAGTDAAVAGAAGGSLASRIGTKFPILRIAVPVVVTVATVKVLGLQKTFEDELHGNWQKAVADEPKWLTSTTAVAGRVAHFFGDKNAYTGNLTATLQGKLANAAGFNESIFRVNADKAAIADFSATLKIANNLLDTNSKTLIGSSQAAQTNRAAIGLLAQKAIDGANAQFRLTGKQSDYSAALRIGIGQIEGAATALGFNKDQVDKLIHSLGLIPPNVNTKVTVDDSSAVINLRAIKDALDRIPAQKFVDIQVLSTGTASAASIAQAASGLGHGLGGGGQADGGIYPRGVPGGIFQWAEAGGESFIPLSPMKRARSLRLWADTGKLLGVQGMADGGIHRTHVGSPGSTPTVGTILNIEHYHAASAVSEDGLAQRLALKTRAVMTARRV